MTVPRRHCPVPLCGAMMIMVDWFGRTNIFSMTQKQMNNVLFICRYTGIDVVFVITALLYFFWLPRHLKNDP